MVFDQRLFAKQLKRLPRRQQLLLRPQLLEALDKLANRRRLGRLRPPNEPSASALYARDKTGFCLGRLRP